MKLLIITQKVDSTDPILGFFHQWLEEFAQHCDQLVVIGQLVGPHNLPDNVHVHSLGKERGTSRFTQIFHCWKLQWKLRRHYDTVLVHMTPIWIVLGAPLWLLLRKSMYLWYEVRRGGAILKTALLLVRKVFCATEHGLPAPSSKQVVVGHGINTQLFAPLDNDRDPHSVVAIGRLTPSKHYEHILHAFASLPDAAELSIVGGTYTDADSAEEKKIQDLLRELGIARRTSVGTLPHSAVASLLQRAQLMLHACVGGLDKVVREAMASGCVVVSTNVAAQQILPEECCATPETLGKKAQALLSLDEEDRVRLAQQLRQIVVEQHGLSRLIERLVVEML